MSENRTEKPTKQHLRKAKQRGQVAKSTFLASALIFTAAVCLIWALSDLFGKRLQEFMHIALSQKMVEGAFSNVIAPLVFPVLTLILGVFLVAIAAHLFQTGWIFVWPKRGKKGKERRIILPLLQMLVILGVSCLSIRTNIPKNLLICSTTDQIAFILRKIFFTGLVIGALLIFLGLSDFIYQKWRYYKKMHMTPEEKKQELRESEGDRKTKGEMHQRR